MTIAIELERLVRGREPGAQRQVAARAFLDLLEDGSPLLIDPGDRVVPADRGERLFSAVERRKALRVRPHVRRRARVEVGEFLFERRAVQAIESGARRLERPGDIGRDDRARDSPSISARKASRRLQSSSLPATEASEATPKSPVIAAASFALTASASAICAFFSRAAPSAFSFSMRRRRVSRAEATPLGDRAGEPRRVVVGASPSAAPTVATSSTNVWRSCSIAWMRCSRSAQSLMAERKSSSAFSVWRMAPTVGTSDAALSQLRARAVRQASRQRASSVSAVPSLPSARPNSARRSLTLALNASAFAEAAIAVSASSARRSAGAFSSCGTAASRRPSRSARRTRSALSKSAPDGVLRRAQRIVGRQRLIALRPPGIEKADHIAARRSRRRQKRGDFVREAVQLPVRRLQVRFRPRPVGFDARERHDPLALRGEFPRMDEPRSARGVIPQHGAFKRIGG